MMADDGLAYVKEDGVVLEGGMRNALALVPITLEGDVVEAAETCPGECIFWEVQESRLLDTPGYMPRHFIS